MAAPPSLEQRLLALLQGSEAAAAGGPRSAPVSACCSPLSRISPGLSVEGVGAVALPLSEAAAGELKAHAQPSPFGRGEQTLLDPSVRRSLQIEPSQLRLANPRERQAASRCRHRRPARAAARPCLHLSLPEQPSPLVSRLAATAALQAGRERWCRRLCVAPKLAWASAKTRVRTAGQDRCQPVVPAARCFTL